MDRGQNTHIHSKTCRYTHTHGRHQTAQRQSELLTFDLEGHPDCAPVGRFFRYELKLHRRLGGDLRSRQVPVLPGTHTHTDT